MSDLSSVVLGMGLEAFDDTPPDTGYRHPVIDDTELEAEGRKVAIVCDQITEETNRVVMLNDARAYGEGSRAALSEVAALELQRRVMSAVGESRAVLVVGSVESYNGPLGEQLLNAGLEGIGNILRSVIETLIRLIRTGTKILFNFLTSSKAILSRQLRAIGELTGAVKNKIEGWEEFQISIGGGNTKVIHGKSGTLAGSNSVTADDLPIDEAVYAERMVSMLPANVRALCKTQNTTLRFPKEFLTELRETSKQLEVVAGTLHGLEAQDTGIMTMIQRAAITPEPDDVNPFIGLTIEEHYPTSKMATIRESNQFNTRLAGVILLGDYQLKITAPPIAMFKASAKKTTSFESARALGNIDVVFECVEPNLDPSSVTIPSLSRADALKVLDQAEAIVDSMLNVNNALDKSLRSRTYEQTLNKLYTIQSGKYADLDYITLLTQAMGKLNTTRDTLATGVVSYANRLANALRQYVAVSAQL